MLLGSFGASWIRDAFLWGSGEWLCWVHSEDITVCTWGAAGGPGAGMASRNTPAHRAPSTGIETGGRTCPTELPVQLRKLPSPQGDGLEPSLGAIRSPLSPQPHTHGIPHSIHARGGCRANLPVRARVCGVGPVVLDGPASLKSWALWPEPPHAEPPSPLIPPPASSFLHLPTCHRLLHCPGLQAPRSPGRSHLSGLGGTCLASSASMPPHPPRPARAEQLPGSWM